MQKERGASAGFLGSNGAAFGQIMQEQRSTTDTQLTQLSAAINDFDTGAFDEKLKGTIVAIQAGITQLNSVRRSVDRQSISVNEQVGFYTGVNSELLAISDALGRFSPTGEIANTATAFSTFLQSKERAGIERAVLSNAFAQKSFTDETYQRFTDLVNTQSVYLSVFRNSASKQMSKVLEDALRDDSFDQVERMRNEARQAHETGEFYTDAQYWFSTITRKINKLKEVEDALSVMVVNDAHSRLSMVSSSIKIFVAILVLSLFISLLVSWIISRQLLNSISNARAVAVAISEGYLGTPVSSTSKDEVGEMLNALGRMQEKLRMIVLSAQETSSSISCGAREIFSSAASLSQRTVDQSSSLENTASSTEEISSTVRHNAERASEAQALAHEAHSYAEEGGSVVEGAVGAMCEITDSSREIEKIISVIDDIAFQTNLLALNAAVEAARAGEQGRGFAVVASEVRTLAGRSAEAAHEIKQLITRSVEKVESGSQMVGRSGETLKKIVNSVSEVRSLMDAMATAGQEQAIGVEGINRSMVEIDSITQKNSTMVNDVSLASESMKTQVQTLADELAFFHMNDPDAKGSLVR